MLKWVWQLLTGQQESTTAKHSGGRAVSQPKKIPQNKPATISLTAQSQKGNLTSVDQSAPSRSQVSSIPRADVPPARLKSTSSAKAPTAPAQ